MQTASTLSADITVPVRKDLQEMVAHVQVNWLLCTIFQVVVEVRFHSITPPLLLSLSVRHMETQGGTPIRKGKGCSLENLNLTPKGD